MSVLLELNDWQLSCFDSNANCFYQQAAAAVADGNGDLYLATRLWHKAEANRKASTVNTCRG